jgi:ribonuclease E
MQEIKEQPTTASEATDGLTAAALRAEAWAGEPFLREGEDPAVSLAPGTSRRRALDDALAEIDAGRREPSAAWKVQYGLMLGLERVLAEDRPHLASGTELRRHQVDALAGMLTELIASHEKEANGANGNGAVVEAVQEEEEPEPEEDSAEDALDAEDDDEEPGFTGPDPGAVRRYRFRHPTASGKTIAAAGFVEAARTLGVLILTHRRLLVSQFQRDLTDEGYGDRFAPAIERGNEPLRGGNPLTIQTYAWFARHQESVSREAYQLVICDEAHTALGEKTSQAIRSFPEPIYIGMTATEQLIAKQVSDVFPASVDDLPL